MRATHRRWTVLLGLAAAAAAAAAEPPPTSSFHYRLETPALDLHAAPDGFSVLSVAGFETHPRQPGTPDVPWRTVLVAIPPGAEPRLVVDVGGSPETVAGVVPRPVPGLRVIEDEDSSSAIPSAGRVERLWRPEAADYGGERVHPQRRAWLGRIGVLREQRYVELHLAPVRFDAAAGGLVREPLLEVTVHFDGAAELGAGGPRADDAFEPVYRRAFVNYAQGRSFRLAGTHPPAPSAAAGARAGAAEPPVRRIVVRQPGMVRLDHALFVAEAPEFLAYDPATWVLTGRGVQIPLDIRQGGIDPAALEAGEWVQFYGQPLDDEPEQVLNADTGGIEDIYEARDFSDDNVYFLTVGPGAQPTIATRDSAPGIGTIAADFAATTHAEVNDVFFPLAGAGIDYWLPLVSETSPQRTISVPLSGLASGTDPAEIRVALRGVSQCDGLSPDHVSRVRLRNTSSETLVLPAGNPDNSGNDNIGLFDGQAMFVHDFPWTHSGGDPQLSDPLEVEIQVDNLPGPCPSGGVVRNDVLVDWIEVDYRRSFVADADGLTFDYPDGSAQFELTGLTSSAVDVYEITGDIAGSGIVDAVRLTGVQVTPAGPTFSVRFRMDEDPAIVDGTPRRFAVAGSGSVASPAPADFRADRVSLLAQDPTPADLVVIAHPDLLDSRCSAGANPCSYDVDCSAGAADRCELVPTSALGQLLAYRAAQGISARVARIQDIEDEFNDGLAGPQAIKQFLAWVVAGGWNGSPPAYALLLGDGSYDFKGGTAAGNYVPTQLMLKKSPILAFYASDNVLADVVGNDHLPDLAIGRVSARTLAEAEAALNKILDYEASPLAGAWRSHAVFISDRANDFGEFEASEFERINRIGEDALAGTSYNSENLRYWTDRCVPSTWTCATGGNVCADDDDCGAGDFCRPDCDTDGMRTAIQDAVNGVSGPGAGLVQFMGHGNFDLWSNDVLFCGNEANPACTVDDTASLTNGAKLPWLIVHNCLSGGFHSLAPKSLGEQWQKHPGGGAIAVFAPSGLGFRFLGQGVTEVIWDDLFGPAKERRIAVPVLDSLVRLCSQDSIEGCQFYTLLGDPTTTLDLPDIDPATDPVAVGDDGVVHLSWTASSTPGATYDVYRTKQLLPPYTLPYERINPAPIAVAGYDDTNVVNTQHYYYYVVAVDPAGFESRWSNFNSDCDVEGPDCLVATPLNPTPPQIPTGLTALDAETGGRLDVRFDPNSEADIDFYTVHYGPTPSLGQTSVSSTIKLSLTGLTNGVAYFVAVAATNTSGATSELSPMVEAVPSLVLGVHSPGFVSDLRLARAGVDAQLIWGAVTEDIYGKPCDVVQYEVYRGNSPAFVPGPASVIAVVATNAYLDAGALVGPGPDYHYLVRAIDAAGNPGGLGRQLPNGTMGLVIGRSATIPGNVVLGWPAVATDFDGAPSVIAGYEVYGADEPFGRAEIQSGAVGPPLLLVGGTSTELAPAAQSRFYSVLAVDVRGNRSPF